MGIINKLEELEQYVLPGGQLVLEDVLPLLFRYSLPALGDQLKAAVSERNKPEIEDTIQQIKLMLTDHYHPPYRQDLVFDEDHEVWINYVDRQYKYENWVALAHAAEVFPFIFDMAGKRYCGGMLDNCGKGCSGIYSQRNQLECSVCGKHRRFCKSGPRATGRCKRHGGNDPISSDIVPATSPTLELQIANHTSYQHRLPGRLGTIYDELTRGATYPSDHLSLLSEIILLRAKVLEAAENLAEFDPVSIQREIDNIRRKINNYMDEDNYVRVRQQVIKLNQVINEASAHKRGWDKVVPLIVTMAKLSQVEQQRILQSKSTVTTEELSMVVNQVVQDFLGMLGGMAEATQRYLNTQFAQTLPDEYLKIEMILAGSEMREDIKTVLARYVAGRMRGMDAPPDVVVGEWR